MLSYKAIGKKRINYSVFNIYNSKDINSQLDSNESYSHYMNNIIFILILSFVLSNPSMLHALFEKSKTIPYTEFTKIVYPERVNNNIYIGTNSINRPIDFNKTSSIVLSKGKIISNILSSDNKLYYLDSQGYVYAYDFRQKKVLWKTSATTSIGKEHFDGGISKCCKKLYVTNGTMDLIVIDINNGDIINMTQSAHTIISKPVVYKKNLFVKMADGSVSSYDKNSLKKIWTQYDTNIALVSQKNLDPFVYNDVLVNMYNSGNIVSYDIENGKVHSQYQKKVSELNKKLSGEYKIAEVKSFSDYIFDKSTLYTCSDTGDFLKISLSNKNLNVKRKRDDIQHVHSMSKLGNTVYFLNNARQLIAMTENLEVIWTNEMNVEERINHKKRVVYFKPLLINNQIIVIDNLGNINVVNPITGSIIDNHKVKSGINSYQVHDNRLYLIYDKHIVVV